jgi:ribosome maturation factor RimP
LIEENIHNLLESTLSQMGYGLVQVRMIGAGAGKILQVMAEKADGTPLMLGDLEKISKTVSSIMDVENAIDSRYHLEVSSPGIDRPLVKRADYERFMGKLVNIRLIRANDKGRKFKGNVVAAGVDSFTFKPENFNENFEIDYSNVDSAKLVITEEMMGKGKKKKFN